MNKYTYCVITKVPDPTKGEAGNLASMLLAFPPVNTESDIYLVSNYQGYTADITPVEYTQFPIVNWPIGEGQLMSPVFHPGELLILDAETGREFSWPRRKPGKWSVEYDTYDDLDDAIERAKQIVNEEETK